MMDWTVTNGYAHTAVRIVSQTAKFYTIVSPYGGGSDRRSKASFIKWRGSQEKAKWLAGQLSEAATERDNRRREASDWFKKTKAELMKLARDS